MDLGKILFDNLTLLAVTAFFVLMMVKGYRRGLVAMVTAIASVIVALAVARMFASKLSEQLFMIRPLREFVEEEIVPNVKGITDEMAMNFISFVLLFVITLALVKVIALALNTIAQLPIINFFNAILGAVFAAVEALAYTWIFMFVVAITQGFVDISSVIMAQISESEILTIIYENNLILNLLSQFVSAV
ncbi:MAG: CvpA family protein [Eubacteriales bacterium]|nr:CvpA family protein [Eubacteriales bacterium]